MGDRTAILNGTYKFRGNALELQLQESNAYTTYDGDKKIQSSVFVFRSVSGNNLNGLVLRDLPVISSFKFTLEDQPDLKKVLTVLTLVGPDKMEFDAGPFTFELSDVEK